MLRLIVILAFSTSLVAQSPGVQRITLEEAQAQAVGATAARLADLGVSAAHHREAFRRITFPSIPHLRTFISTSSWARNIQLARRTAELPLLAKHQTIVAFTLTQLITPLLKFRQAVRIAKAEEVVAQAKMPQLTAHIAAIVEQTYFGLLMGQRQRSPATKELAQSLNVMLGFSPDTELELARPQPMSESISLEEAMQQAIANSPEIVDAEQSVVKARAATKIARLEYMPDVAVIGGYVYQTAPKDFSYIGFAGSMYIFDFGRREKTINERKAQLGMAEVNVDMVKAKVAANVQKAFIDLERTRKIRDLTRRLVSSDRARLISYEASAEGDLFQETRLSRRLFSASANYERLVEGRNQGPQGVLHCCGFNP